MSDRYTILIKGKETYSDLTQFEYMERMEDLAIEFYKTGSPDPTDVTKKITFSIANQNTIFICLRQRAREGLPTVPLALVWCGGFSLVGLV